MTVDSPADHYWTPEQDDRLLKMARAGESVSNIAKQLNRSRGSIRLRAARLQIVLAKSWKPKIVGA
jgi:DNA-binding NarL/FixJ family response regulator